MTAIASYWSSPIKRHRRTKAEMKSIEDSIVDIVFEAAPMSVRQVFYQCSVRGVVEKTEKEYDTVQRLLVRLRRSGRIPYDAIADSTRWMRKPDSHRSLAAFLDDQQESYRRSLWHDQEDYVEIWLEKDSLAGVIYPITAEYDVPLMVTRGFASLSFIHNAAEAIRAKGKPAFIYYFGDHDPSGIDIDRKVEAGLREFSPEVQLHFRRQAVRESQIEQLQLPTRPTKKSDSRSKNFSGESVELDAVPAATLRKWVRLSIEHHINACALERTRAIEEVERSALRRFAESMA